MNKMRRVTVAMSRGGTPEHWLHKGNVLARRLTTACGGGTWLDGLGKRRIGYCNAYKVNLLCPRCQSALKAALNEWEEYDSRRLFDA